MKHMSIGMINIPKVKKQADLDQSSIKKSLKTCMN